MDTQFSALYGNRPTSLRNGVTVRKQVSRSGWGTSLVYRTPAYVATVRVLNWLMAKMPESRLGSQDLRRWIPPGPGEYWIGDGSAVYRFEDPKPQGKIRKFFCKLRIHWKRRIPGYWNRVWQCPYCLNLKIKWPREPRSISVGWGSEFIEQEQWILRANFKGTRAPNGPGKPAWVEVGVRKVAPGRYVGSLDDAIDRLTSPTS